MPRKAPNQVIEHRISFSDKERQHIQDMINTQKANIAIDGVTSTLQAVGSSLAGGGILWASIGLVAWFGGGLLLEKGKTTLEKTWGWINEVANPISDFIVDATHENAPLFDTEYWREIAREDSLRIAEAQAKVDKYAVPGSSDYDVSKGHQAREELLQAVKIRNANLDLERQAREAHQEYFRQDIFPAPLHYTQLVYAYREQYRAWVEGGRVGDPPEYPDLANPGYVT